LRVFLSGGMNPESSPPNGVAARALPPRAMSDRAVIVASMKRLVMIVPPFSLFDCRDEEGSGRGICRNERVKRRFGHGGRDCDGGASLGPIWDRPDRAFLRVARGLVPLAQDAPRWAAWARHPERPEGERQESDHRHMSSQVEALCDF